jgi:hypothetical protein
LPTGPGKGAGHPALGRPGSPDMPGARASGRARYFRSSCTQVTACPKSGAVRLSLFKLPAVDEPLTELASYFRARAPVPDRELIRLTTAARSADSSTCKDAARPRLVIASSRQHCRMSRIRSRQLRRARRPVLGSGPKGPTKARRAPRARSNGSSKLTGSVMDARREPSSSAYQCPSRGQRVKAPTASHASASRPRPADRHTDSAPTRKMGRLWVSVTRRLGRGEQGRKQRHRHGKLPGCQGQRNP